MVTYLKMLCNFVVSVKWSHRKIIYQNTACLEKKIVLLYRTIREVPREDKIHMQASVENGPQYRKETFHCKIRLELSYEKSHKKCQAETELEKN